MRNMTNKFLEEAKQIEEKWRKSSDPFVRNFARTMTAKDMECQRLHNETGTWDCCDECKEKESKDATIS